METEINQDRLNSTMAALIYFGFSVPKLIYWLEGPHLAIHRNVPDIIQKLRPSVDPEVLQELKRIFTFGSPAKCSGTSSYENFLGFLRYGNHASAANNEQELLKVFQKDVRRGFAVALDERSIPFIQDLHVTPLGIVDLDNPWKPSRPVFDSSFHPHPWSMAINDWCNKSNEPQVQFPGSFERLLTWIWNLRITYPRQRILVGDNDITGAFRLIKYNPYVVSMHGYVVSNYLGLATGQTFGDNVSPGNFEIPAIARQQHAAYLWKHQPQYALQKAHSLVGTMQHLPEATPSESSTMAQANPDSRNPGALAPDGTRLPPPFPHQVDDCMFADTVDHIVLTSSASIAALLDIFGEKHPCQEHVLSMEKLRLEYTETREVVGQFVNTHTMTVSMTERRRGKILSFLQSEGWLQPKKATIQEIASLYGLLDNASHYFQWGRAQLLTLRSLLRDCIIHAYRAAQASHRIHQRIEDINRVLPRELKERLNSLSCRVIAEFVWRHRRRVTIDRSCRAGIRIIHDYLHKGLPWTKPFGHIVRRDPAICIHTDASTEGIATYIPSARVFCILPLSEGLWKRISRSTKNPDAIHINILEFIGIILGFIIAQDLISQSPDLYPPTPIAHVECDNTSAIAWSKRMSSSSIRGQNLLRLFAEFTLHSPVGLSATHIPGVDNHMADFLSRPCDLYSPKLSFPWQRDVFSHIQEACRKQSDLASWTLFLPSHELLFSLCSRLSSTAKWERPQKPRTNGQFVPCASILSGSFKNTISIPPYSL